MIRKWIRSGFMLFLACFLAYGQAAAQDAAGNSIKGREKVKETKVKKELQGEVTWIRKNKISLLYATDEETGMDNEILLPIGKDTQFEHVKGAEQIMIGDRVRIQFEEKTQEGGTEGVVTYRTAKVISFISRPPQKMNPREPEANVLSSE